MASRVNDSGVVASCSSSINVCGSAMLRGIYLIRIRSMGSLNI